MKSGSFEIILLFLSIFAGVAAVNSPDNYRSPNQQNQAYPSPYPTPYPSQTIIVTNTNDSGFGSLRQAIADANSNGWDKITFAAYLAGETINLQSTLVINKYLTIDATTLSQKITLSGDSDNDGDGDILLINIATNTEVVIRNIKFTKGYSLSSTSAGAINNLGELKIYNSEFTFNSGDQGGAIRNSNQLFIESSSFSNNTANEGGAILNNLNAFTNINTVTFTNNSAYELNNVGGGGGAVANVGNISIYNSEFIDNNATGGGGFINSFGGTATLFNNIFTGNSATEHGGGAVNNFEGSVEIYSSTFTNNSAVYGGAIIAGQRPEDYQTFTTISESIISNNQATGGGGGIEFDSGTSMTIDKTTISGNTAPAGGGIVNVSGNLLTITNSTIANNISTQSPQPGGVLSLHSPVTIKNSTITGNNHTAVGIQGHAIISNTTIAGNSGYGLEVFTYSLSITNSILANNGNFDCRTQWSATVTTNENNLIETNSGCGTPALTADPLLGPLADNGGLTETMALLSNSPAIDAGNNTKCEDTDQRGVIRPQGTVCDMGAYETTVIFVPTTTITSTSTSTSTATSTATPTITSTRTPTATLTPTVTRTPTSTVTTTPTATNTITPTVTVVSNPPASLDPAKISFQEVISGLSNPVFITHAEDGSERIFIVERSGRIRIIKNGTLLATPFLDIQSLVKSTSSEQGLLGLAFHPSYESNGKFYVFYTATKSGDSNGSILTLRQYSVSSGNPDIANSNSGSTILTIDHPTHTNHNGGTILFGEEGYLYWSTGDGGSGGDPSNNAQQLNNLLGKILRIDIDSGAPYSIPTSNPFYNSSDPNIKKEIWSYGLRNPWRISFDRLTHDLYIGDVGQGVREEIDFQSVNSIGGENYGWRIMEGSLCYNPSNGCNQSGKVLPIAEYDHSLGCSVTGGYVYRGSTFPSMYGYYIYGDFCSGRIFTTYNNLPTGWTTPTQVADTAYNISTFGEDESGNIYFADYSAGKIYKIVYQEPTYNISGNVSTAGVILNYIDGTPKTAISQADGSYIINVSNHWTGTVTPNHTCYTFTPSSRIYSDVTTNYTNQNYTPTFNSASGCASIDVSIGGVLQGTYPLASETSEVVGYVVDGGPVVIESTNGVDIVASMYQQRRRPGITAWTGVAQAMALPVELITDRYVIPRYDYTSPTTKLDQILIANVDTVTRDITVTIGGNVMGVYTLAPAQSQYLRYSGVAGGPVVVSSDTGAKIVASLYQLLRDPAFAGWNGQEEMMGLPWSQVSDQYLIPMYFGASNPNVLVPYLYLANVDTIATNIEVRIAGILRGTYTLQPSTVQVVNYVIDGGPVEIKSTNGANIVASLYQQRRRPGTTAWTGAAHSMALPVELITNSYVIPRYNYTSPTTKLDQILIANVDTVTRDITITIDGDVMGVYTLAPAESQYIRYTGISGGPVVVSSVTGAKIVASQYQLVRDPALAGWNDQAEMMGLPFSQLSNQYLIPLYFGASNPNVLIPYLFLAVP